MAHTQGTWWAHWERLEGGQLPSIQGLDWVRDGEQKRGFIFLTVLLRYDLHAIKIHLFYVYNSMIFSKFKELHNHPHNPVLDLNYPKRPLLSVCSQCLFPLPPQATTDLLLDCTNVQ